MSSALHELFEESEIFITGGTGCIGKAYLDKILRAFNVKKVYILMREKRGKSVNVRLESFKNNVFFGLLRSQKPQELDKLQAVAGDISMEGLGISEEDLDLMKNVSFVIHCAATINFTEPLRNAIALNVRGTRDTLEIAKGFKNLHLFMYTSTYYSNCNLELAEEKVHTPPMEWRSALKLLKYDVDTLNALTLKIIGDFPNTYTFTKNIAESIVNEYSQQIPTSIVRPAIVIASFFEPIPYYLDNYTATNGVSIAFSTGMVNFTILDKDRLLNNVRLDTTVFLTLLSVVPAVARFRDGKSVYVLNISGFGLTAATVCDLFTQMKKSIELYPSEKCLFGVPEMNYVKSKAVFSFRFFFEAFLPVLILEKVMKFLKLTSSKVSMASGLRLFFMSNMLYSFFVSSKFRGINDNQASLIKEAHKYPGFQNLPEMLAYKDEELCDLYTKGIRRHIFKEDDSTIPRARRRYKVIKAVSVSVKFGFWLLLAYFVLGFILRRLLE